MEKIKNYIKSSINDITARRFVIDVVGGHYIVSHFLKSEQNKFLPRSLKEVIRGELPKITSSMTFDLRFKKLFSQNKHIAFSPKLLSNDKLLSFYAKGDKADTGNIISDTHRKYISEWLLINHTKIDLTKKYNVNWDFFDDTAYPLGEGIESAIDEINAKQPISLFNMICELGSAKLIDDIKDIFKYDFNEENIKEQLTNKWRLNPQVIAKLENMIISSDIVNNKSKNNTTQTQGKILNKKI